ncbi:tRNA(Ile)-lysidine synthase [Pannonibacter phragmitetus]|uniref:tRNA(Ile)-lysidine synthase n=1 Tax=Pannonibacter phragmitetus TaxID=121719 RepID=A0A378ZZ63_9HYPH|nr:tRNA lysidine(34) synthetase TilS [Pannonibacter phragmitetus]SUB02525.1 tRNA(Ile)-lysidine synthase [Pannonibacter phragmitetus]
MIRPAPNSSVPAAPDFSSVLPVSDDEAARLLAPLERFSSLALAVSGGGDSLALLHLTAGWARARHSAGLPAPRLLVLTVDHGLRPEAASEARFVRQQAEALQLPAKILTWQAPQGLANLQAEARMARYSLLADAMDLSGVEALVLAHHLDDQIETFFDRLTRGSGVYGLAAMAADQCGGPFGLRLLRPFLTVPGARLKASLVARGLSWVDDPSNSNPAYKRVRLRQLQAGLLLEGLDPSRIGSTIRRMARAAQAIDAAADVLLKDACAGDVPDFARLDLARLTPLPEEVRLRLLARLAQHVGGNLHPPRLDRLETLDARLLAGGPLRVTLAGVVFDLFAGGRLRLWPEPGRSLPDTVELLPGQCVHWDGRYRICLKPDAGGSLRIAPVARLRQDEALREDVRVLASASGFPAAAFARLPAVMRLYDGGRSGLACLAWTLPREPGLVLRRTADQVMPAAMADN